MEGDASWVSHSFDEITQRMVKFESFLDHNCDYNRTNIDVNVDLILPDDLLERIFLYLPVASILRAGSVCKRWHNIVSSKRFLWSLRPSQKPWYFMFTSSDKPNGFGYDPVLKKWHNIELPCIHKSNWFVASSHGLVCFMDNDSRSEIYVCNPITKDNKKLDEPPGLRLSDYSAVAISVNRSKHSYQVSIVKSKQIVGNFLDWDVSVQIYNSETMAWMMLSNEVMTGWRSGSESVICNGVLYFMIYSTSIGVRGNRHGLITFDMSSKMQGLFTKIFIPAPCALTCGRLMNLGEKLFMVGGLEKLDHPGIIKGIGIWVLEGTEWRQVDRMPSKFFHGFGEFDDVFASSGMDDLIYIQSYGSPCLLVFDISHRQWKWSQKSPVIKRFPLQLFTGFSFEPRLDVAP